MLQRFNVLQLSIQGNGTEAGQYGLPGGPRTSTPRKEGREGVIGSGMTHALGHGWMKTPAHSKTTYTATVVALTPTTTPTFIFWMALYTV